MNNKNTILVYPIDFKDRTYEFYCGGLVLDIDQKDIKEWGKSYVGEIALAFPGARITSSLLDSKIRVEYSINRNTLEDFQNKFPLHPIFICDNLDHPLEIRGQSSFIIVFKEKLKKEEVIARTSDLAKIEDIFPDTWLLNYYNEADAEREYNKFYNLKFRNLEIEYLEPNFSTFAKRRYGKAIPEYVPKIFDNGYLNGKEFELIGFKNGSKTKLDEANLRIAVLDSKINLSHDCFRDVISHPENCIYMETAYGISEDELGSHGTSCASLICGYEQGVVNDKTFLGLVEDVELIAVQVVQESEDKAQKYSLASLLRGLYYAAFESGVDVISCSWSYPYESTLMQDLIKKITTEGVDSDNTTIPIVFAAGNDTDYTHFPACMDEVIAVGAIDDEGNYIDKNHNEFDWYSAEGKIDICAPGRLATAKVKNDKKSEKIDSNHYPDYHMFEGTSCAAPVVAAAIVYYKRKYFTKKISAMSMKSLIKQNAIKSLSKNWNKNIRGPGIINFNI